MSDRRVAFFCSTTSLIYYQEFWITMTQKVAVITGSHKGLGYAIARQSAQKGKGDGLHF
jgi:hypothetical protein